MVLKEEEERKARDARKTSSHARTSIHGLRAADALEGRSVTARLQSIGGYLQILAYILGIEQSFGRPRCEHQGRTRDVRTTMDKTKNQCFLVEGGTGEGRNISSPVVSVKVGKLSTLRHEQVIEIPLSQESDLKRTEPFEY